MYTHIHLYVYIYGHIHNSQEPSLTYIRAFKKTPPQRGFFHGTDGLATTNTLPYPDFNNVKPSKILKKYSSFYSSSIMLPFKKSKYNFFK